MKVIGRDGYWSAKAAGDTALAAIAAALVSVSAIHLSPDTRCLALFWSSMILSAIVLAVAMPRQKRRAIPAGGALAILAVALVRNGFRFSDNAFFIAFCVAIACLLVSMAIDQRRERRERENLEIQLLRKMIEPHFVMNTLTAISEWLEEDPAAGVQFLEAFAEELRMFSSISRGRTIPIADEIALSVKTVSTYRTRILEKMSMRTNAELTHYAIRNHLVE